MEDEMNAARIIAPFTLSAILSVLAYLFSLNTGSGFFPIMLYGIGALMAFVGIVAIFSKGKND
jgi:fatty acid desaturase